MKVWTLVMLLCILAGEYSVAQQATTWAGTGTAGQCANNTQKAQCPLDGPWGIAVDSKGRVWISEENGSVLKVVLTDGTVWVRGGAYATPGYKDGAGTASRLSYPRGIAVNKGDSIFIADQGNNLIRLVMPFSTVGNAQMFSVYAGAHTTGGGTPGFLDGSASVAKFNQPSDVAVDAAGNVYVADEGNHCIRKITRTGVVSTFAGVPQTPGFKDGSVSVAKFNYPRGIFAASNGDIYVADMYGQRLRKISGGIVSTVGNFSSPPLYSPNDVVMDKSNNLYLTDENRIFKFTGSSIYDFAGPHDPMKPGYKNASDTSARFNAVRGIAVDPTTTGFVYVADQNNNVIRKVTVCNLAKPNVTVAGKLLTCSVTATNYQWYNGGTLISGATQKTYTALVTGDYSVKITDGSGCTSISDPVHVVVVSINDVQQEETFRVFPNPGDGKFTIRISPSGSRESCLKVTDINGQIVYKQTIENTGVTIEKSVDLSNLKTGIYLFEFDNGKDISKCQVIIR